MSCPYSPAEPQQDTPIAVDKCDPWLKDGNIIISCEGAARFRVHISVMERRSEVFRNMFADATPNPGVETVEGCPVIGLSDKVGDCKNLMLALYGPVLFKMETVDDFLHLSSILLIATKYCVGCLRNKAIAYLSRSWPHTLKEWVPPSLVTDPVPHPALVVDLARAADVPILLPIALYRLGRLSVDEVYETEFPSCAGPIVKSACILSPEDVLNHVRYKTQEFDSARSFVHDFVQGFRVNETCRNKHKCTCLFEELPSVLRRLYFDKLYTPICFMDAAVEYNDGLSASACDVCSTRFKAGVEAKKLELWNALPKWFNLPGWDSSLIGYVNLL